MYIIFFLCAAGACCCGLVPSIVSLFGAYRDGDAHAEYIFFPISSLSLSHREFGVGTVVFLGRRIVELWTGFIASGSKGTWKRYSYLQAHLTTLRALGLGGT